MVETVPMGDLLRVVLVAAALVAGCLAVTALLVK